MKVTIIGAGNVGRALATSVARAGHDVTLAARDAAKTAATASELGVAAGTIREAAADADVVVLAVPADALRSVAVQLAGVVEGRPVVDATNRMQPDPAAPSNAETLQADLPNTPVVKAFNTAFASRQADPLVGGIAVDGYVAADDAAAKQVVLALVESVGFRPVDAGSLAVARTLEGLAWINISRNLQGGTWQGGLVLLEPGQVPAAASDR